MGLFLKDNGIWAVNFTDAEGNRRRVSTGVRDKRDAARIAADLKRGAPPPSTETKPDPEPAPAEPKGMTMDAMFKECELDVWSPRRCRSQATVRSNLRILREVLITQADGRKTRFADLEVSKVGSDTLKRLASALRAMDYAEASVKRKMDMVGRALTEACDMEIITGRPKMPPMDKTPPRKRVLSHAEEAAAFAAIEARTVAEPTRDWKRTGLLFRFLLEMGTRLGETLLMRDSWFSEVRLGDERAMRWVITIPAWATKSNRDRILPLTPAVVAMLPYLMDNGVETEPVSASRIKGGDRRLGSGKRLFPYLPGAPWYRWTNIRDDLAKQGIDVSDVVIHTFRHTCLSRMYDRKVPLEVISDWAGHSNVLITKAVYVKSNASHLLPALAPVAPVLVVDNSEVAA